MAAIDNERQNKTRLLVEDFAAFGVPADETLRILLRRGVFKWFACRRDIIRLGHNWKGDVRAANGEVAARRGRRGRAWWRGRLAALVACRKAVSGICHSPRLRAADNDRMAQRFLRERSGGKEKAPR